MKNTTKTNASQLSLIINSIILSKGTAFAGFDYNGKRRNVTVGANLGERQGTKANWGVSFTNNSLVAYRGEMFLQGIENNIDGSNQIKRFNLSKAENFVIG